MSHGMDFSNELNKQLSAIGKMLGEKNKAYGDSALNPVRCFSRADTIEQLKVRIDDKLSRIRSGDPSKDMEDVVLDLIGYLILLRIAQARLNG